MSNLLYAIPMAECAYLQFRQVLELIATASLVATETDDGSLMNSISDNHRRSWHAGDILKTIKDAYPDYYYPEPLRLDASGPAPPGLPEGAFKNYVGELVTANADYLTYERFKTLYGTANGLLHTPNPFNPRAKPKDQTACLRLLADGPKWTRRIIALLTHHTFKFVKKPDSLYVCHTVGSASGSEFKITEFQRLDDVTNTCLGVDYREGIDRPRQSLRESTAAESGAP